MKILGKVGNDSYIAEVSHTELEKVFDKYYGRLSKLDVGQEINLGTAYNFYQDIQRLTSKFIEASTHYTKCSNSLQKYLEGFTEGNQGGEK